MDGDESRKIVEYDVREDEDGFHAQFRRPLSAEALTAGCKQALHATSFRELELSAIANRIKAAWYS